MDIFLINPPYRSLKGMPTDCGYDVGLTGLAAYARKEGLEASVLTGDLLVNSPSTNKWLSMDMKKYAAGQKTYEKVINDKKQAVWTKIADYIHQIKPMAIGIPYYTPVKHVVYTIASLAKEINDDIKTIVGSFHPTLYPEEVMQNPDIDFVIRGEGEIPLINLLKELKKEQPDFGNVPSLYYRGENGQILSNDTKELIQNLDDLPFPARDLVINCDFNDYKTHIITTNRGCPYKCTFCADRGLWGKKVRRRSVASVIKEIKQLQQDYQINSLEIVDGTFTYDREYLTDFCNTLIENKIVVNWSCTARYDNLDEELLQIMKKATCSGLYLGLESGSDKILKIIDKDTDVQNNIRVNKLIRQSGIPSVNSVLFGVPEETEEDMEKTLELMKTVKTEIFDINSYIPLAGTTYYDSMSEKEREALDWSKIGLKSPNNYFLRHVSHEDFQQYMTEAHKIANNVRNKTIIRFALKKIFGFIPGINSPIKT